MDLTHEEKREFEQAFAMLDYEKDGSVSVKELNRFMLALGKKPTDQQLQEMINAVDTDGTGTIEFPEFVTAMTVRMCEEPDEDEVREAFRVFDRENNGYIGADQIRVVLLDLNTKLDEEEIEEMIRDADFDGDGVVSYDDFYEMMTVR